jgi:hypothetical protein
MFWITRCGCWLGCKRSRKSLTKPWRRSIVRLSVGGWSQRRSRSQPPITRQGHVSLYPFAVSNERLFPDKWVKWKKSEREIAQRMKDKWSKMSLLWHPLAGRHLRTGSWHPIYCSIVLGHSTHILHTCIPDEIMLVNVLTTVHKPEVARHIDVVNQFWWAGIWSRV